MEKDLVKKEEQEIAPEKQGNKYSLVNTWLGNKQILRILRRTPAQYVHTRPGKGGGQWEYVSGAYVRKVLNFVFGWLWDFEVTKQEVVGLQSGYGQVIVLGRLTVKDSKGNSLVKMSSGRADIKYRKNTKIPLDLGNDYKAAETDSLKRCASQLGIASDIYSKNEFRDIVAEEISKKAKVANTKAINNLKGQINLKLGR